MVTDELFIHIPASRAATDISARAFLSFPFSYANGRYLKILLTADRARTSVKGCAALDVYASTAWVRASRPVEAVIVFGIVSVASGSTTAISGTSPSPLRSIFTSVAASVITVNFVASEPVPAVVGMAVMGGNLPVISFPI